MDIKSFLAIGTVIVAMGLLMSQAAFAHEGEHLAAVSFADLGVSEPRVLPSSPVYVFKSIGRFFQRLVIFDPIKRAELELRIADETLAEAKKTAETDSENSEALIRAIKNYGSAHERLQMRLEALKDISQNPNLDALMEKLSDRAIKHEDLFEGLREKMSGEEARKSTEELVESLRGFVGRYGKGAEERRIPIPAQTPRSDIVCNQVFNPVCGKDGKTYSNACHAEAAGTTLDYRGECKNPFEFPPARPKF